ncbi:MAG: hypothetical protein IPP29_00980 [Bacteroidetes bacterium]|nr:hypothetical protein [Bacteroidota bacterium]
MACVWRPITYGTHSASTVISATHDAYISLNQSTFTLQCNKQNGALACLSNNGEILDVQPIVNGTATFNFNALIVLDTIQLTITGFNCKPYLTDLPVLLTGLDEQENNLSLSVFPNPANDMLTVTIKDFGSRTNNVEILSETGAQVMNLTFAEIETVLKFLQRNYRMVYILSVTKMETIFTKNNL